MDHFHNNDLEYVVNDPFEDDFFSEDEPQRNDDSDDAMNSDFEDDFVSSKPKTDTSALEARNGKDIQGIPWERLNFTRDKYRETRLKQYKNYENLSRPRFELHKECLEVEKGKTFYDFEFNTRLVKSTIVHFQAYKLVIKSFLDFKAYFLEIYLRETSSLFSSPLAFVKYLNTPQLNNIELGFVFTNGLSSPYFSLLSRVEVLSEQLAQLKIRCLYGMLRNLLWATSKNDVYLMQNYSVMHWSSLLWRGKEVLNVAKPVAPTRQRPGLLSQSLSRVQISTMAVKENLMVAGGFQGELICKCLDQPGVAFCSKITTGENAITNAVDVYRNHNGSMRIMAANNDAQVRVFDAETFASLNCFSFDWSVNNTSVSPDGKLLAVLGDSAECLIADANSGKVTGSLKGHLDYSFSSAWHPDGLILATGNQDTTCRLWDVRNLSQSLAVLKGNMGAIRALKFTSDGKFLAMAEPADFVHVFDTQSDYLKCQEIDLFGEIAGISFSPDTEALFVGVADRTYGSLLEFNRRHYNFYLDSIF
ncbi:hypothetical protein NC652_014114 [Populus alba x Populus x berolinensis]|nr:hypothetical protein NC652_014114 [Populus alba x Populus x berolinensis]